MLPENQFTKEYNRIKKSLLHLVHVRLVDPEFVQLIQDDPEEFHSILIRAQQQSLIHYSRLAAALKLDENAVFRWFSEAPPKRKTPDRIRRVLAIEALAKLISRDIAELADTEAPIGADIGGHSVREDPRIGIALFGETSVTASLVVPPPKRAPKVKPAPTETKISH